MSSESGFDSRSMLYMVLEQITSEIRRHMEDLGYLEVETPVLQVLPQSPLLGLGSSCSSYWRCLQFDCRKLSFFWHDRYCILSARGIHKMWILRL